MSSKFTRIGHRMPQNGVITIFSTLIENGHIKYGVSYCSPKEFTPTFKDTVIDGQFKTVKVSPIGYVREVGNKLAVERHDSQIGYSGVIHFPFKPNHHQISMHILMDIISRGQYPFWAYRILLGQVYDTLDMISCPVKF